MIPKVIHYCWFGKGEMPELAKDCIRTWHENMPDWEYKLWNEDNFDVRSTPYTMEAYEAGKYAFVSDYVRLKALKEEGGVYLDTDVKTFKSLEPLLSFTAFAGFEGSKHTPIGTCILGSEPDGKWVSEQLGYYEERHFIKDDRSFDTTTNVTFITGKMKECGLMANGLEQDCNGLHIFPVDYFCPRHTTGEYIKTDNTYCDHLGIGSWVASGKSWKSRLLALAGRNTGPKIIKLKRKLFG